MTLLVVLGVVVVVTILAALFLSLRSGRNRDGASAAGQIRKDGAAVTAP